MSIERTAFKSESQPFFPFYFDEMPDERRPPLGESKTDARDRLVVGKINTYEEITPMDKVKYVQRKIKSTINRFGSNHFVSLSQDHT